MNETSTPDSTRIRVIVTVKPEMLDPQGLAVQEACLRLGFDELKSVRQGKCFDLILAQNDEKTLKNRVDLLCRTLLVNPVVEDVEFIFDPSDNSRSAGST